jgi:hypothetical protein
VEYKKGCTFQQQQKILIPVWASVPQIDF